MAANYTELSPQLIQFIENQQIFFTGTARSSGSVNVSPKGSDSLRILDPNRLVWLNLTGSGNETAAHLLENNRMTLMFCAFDKKPLILRLYGNAETIHSRDLKWDEYMTLFPAKTGARQLFLMTIERVQTSCGFAVPYFEYQGDRNALDVWTEKKGAEGIKTYWQEMNSRSIDGFETGI